MKERKAVKRNWISAVLLIVLFTVFLYIPVEAAQKNVTNTYKQKATETNGDGKPMGTGKSGFQRSLWETKTVVHLAMGDNNQGRKTPSPVA